MNNKREILIAVVVAALMIIICAAIVIVNSGNEEESNIQVYKHVEINGKGGYVPCEISSSIKIELVDEFNKAKKLTDKDIAVAEQINGNYQIVIGKTSFAFDSSQKNKIYNINKNILYDFESPMYSIVETICK